MADPRSGTASVAIDLVEATRQTGEPQSTVMANGAQVRAVLKPDGSIAWAVTSPDGRVEHEGLVPPRIKPVTRGSSVSLLSILTRMSLSALRKKRCLPKPVQPP